MPQNLGAKEAADAIRGVFFSDRSMRADPQDAHRMKFAKDVVRELGGDESPETVHHVMRLLREHHIELHAGHEFPKYATRKWDRTAKIVHSEDEERNWINEEQPAPSDPDDLPAARTLDAPVQDLSLDLRNKVPHMAGDAPQPERLPRVPSAVTNREAAQDAYARQPMGQQHGVSAGQAYDRANPDLDHQNQDAAHGEGEFTDHDDTQDFEQDDEVHVEDLAPTGNAQQGGAPYAKPADAGVMAHDDPDRDGFAGQDANPTHDNVLGTSKPQHRSGASSAGTTDTARRPVGVESLRDDDEPGAAAQRADPPRKPVGNRRPE